MEPIIGGPDRHDFHDSSLLDVTVSPQLDAVEMVLCVPDEYGGCSNWLVRFVGVLRLEFEITDAGIPANLPVDIYEVYVDSDSCETARWKDRLAALGADDKTIQSVSHVVLASSSVRGWGKNEHLAGITIICQGWTIRSAPRSFDKKCFRWPTIEAAE